MNHSTTLRPARFTAMAVLVLAGSTACTKDQESQATGPVAAHGTQVPQGTQAPQVNESGIPTKEILGIVAAQTAAWAAKDAAAYVSAAAPDVRLINPVGALFSGRDALRGIHVFLFNGPFAGSTLNLAVRDIQFLTGTTAIVYLDLSITGYAFLPPGAATPSDGVVRARVTWVVEKRGGEWEILFIQQTPQP
jgi:uncharacterized protein (TIGR02246 family)